MICCTVCYNHIQLPYLLLTMSGSNTTASCRNRAMVVDPPNAKYPISSPLAYVLPTSAVKRMDPTCNRVSTVCATAIYNDSLLKGMRRSGRL